MPSFMWCSSLLPWIFTLIFFTCQLFAAPLSYSDHCASFVPQAVPELYSIASATLPFCQRSQGFYSGGDPILKDSTSSSFTFQTQAVQKTDREGVVKVDADLMFTLSENGGFSSVSFRLEGFWSASSGRLCMVGSNYATRKGNEVKEDLKLKSVLKLNNVYTSSSIKNLITGTLESLSSDFDPISMLMFPQKNYTYSLLAPQETVDISKTRLNPDRNRFCSMVGSWYDFRLKYAEHCDSAKNCSPFQGSNFLPSIVPNVIGCDCGTTQMRILLQFSNRSSSGRQNRDSSSFEPNTALVGEGFLDEKANLLRFDACRISVAEGLSLSDAHVEDCSISFNFRFPTVWTLKERDSIVAEIKSKKSPNESGYFGKITARRGSGFPSYNFNKKYEYSQIDRISELCPDKNQSGSIGTYPNWDSSDLSFQMFFETPRGKKVGEGHSSPLFVGDQLYRPQYYSRSKNNDAPIIQGKPSKNTKLKMSYTMTATRLGNVKFSSSSTIFNGSCLGGGMVISAEGLYDGLTGSLCMIGCRRLVDSMDCEILIKLQFPPLDYVKKDCDSSITGSIESLRKRSDRLYFDSLKVSTMSLYEQRRPPSIWWLVPKLTLVLVSSTLSCIFAAWQLFYVKKHPHVVSFASQLMLIVLILGHAIPLMLNFDGSFQDYRLGYSPKEERWIQTSEVLVRAATLLAILLEFCLLQQSFSATRRKNKSLVAEKKAIFLTLSLYAFGALAAIFINMSCANNPVWDAPKWFPVRLVHGGFLLPQILVNIFRNSKEKILSVPFYIGTTLIRVMPYGYALWEYGNFGTAWDVIIPLGSLLFGGIVYLQQRFGGRSFVPRRFRTDSVADEKIPLIGHS